MEDKYYYVIIKIGSVPELIEYKAPNILELVKKISQEKVGTNYQIVQITLVS